MKKIVSVYVLLLTNIYAFSQNLDLIVTSKGDSIICKIDSITENKIYFHTKSINNQWALTMQNLDRVKDYKYNIILGTTYFQKKDISNLEIKDLNYSYGSQSNISKKKIFRSWISFNEVRTIYNGILYETRDSSVLLAMPTNTKYLDLNQNETYDIQIDLIKNIKFRKQNNVGKGILIGASTGLLTAAILGLAGGDSNPQSGTLSFSQSSIFILAAVPLVTGGALIGAGIGSVKVKIPINGNFNTYQNNRNELNKYVYHK